MLFRRELNQSAVTNESFIQHLTLLFAYVPTDKKNTRPTLIRGSCSEVYHKKTLLKKYSKIPKKHHWQKTVYFFLEILPNLSEYVLLIFMYFSFQTVIIYIERKSRIL